MRVEPTQSEVRGAVTYGEILQQPELWPTTLERVNQFADDHRRIDAPVVLTGAGTSAYAAISIAAGWPGALAIPTTDLLVSESPFRDGHGLLISLARSGDSPESLGVVKRIQRLSPGVQQLAIVCNPASALGRAESVKALVLDPRANDRGLAMTSSFSNLVLAGLALRHYDELHASLPPVLQRLDALLPVMAAVAQETASAELSRVVVLGSSPLTGLVREATLKILELSGGQVAVLAETFLGLRHGPMSFLREDTVVLAFLSSDLERRRYEIDLLLELRAKRLGKLLAISGEAVEDHLCDVWIPAPGTGLRDELRTPFDVVFAQLLAYYLSLEAGLDPDSPSPDGVITRVVTGVRVYE